MSYVEPQCAPAWERKAETRPEIAEAMKRDRERAVLWRSISDPTLDSLKPRETPWTGGIWQAVLRWARRR